MRLIERRDICASMTSTGFEMEFYTGALDSAQYHGGNCANHKMIECQKNVI